LENGPFMLENGDLLKINIAIVTGDDLPLKKWCSSSLPEANLNMAEILTFWG
jgi:hypothetical protein